VEELDRAVSLDRTLDFLQGRLENRDVATLFFSFFATGRSGKLCVMEGKEVLQLWFHRGWPVFAETNRAGMELSEWLVRRGKVDGDAMAEARTEWMDIDRSLGVVLVARGVIGARTLFDETRTNVDAVVRQLFDWTVGHYYVEYSQNPATYQPPETVSLYHSPTHYVVNGVREYYSRERCTRILSTAQGRIEVSDAAHFILRELADPYYYENVIAQLGSGSTAPKLLQMHPFSKDDDALRAVCALWIVGGVIEKISDEQLRKVRRSTASQADRIREAVASAASGEHPDVRAAREARIRGRLDRRKKKAAARRKSDVASIMTALDKVSAEVAYENGAKLLARRRYKEAARALAEAVRLAPHQAGWYSTLAQAYLAQDDAGPEELDAALQTLKRGAALDPRNGEPYHWLGMVLMRMGHPDEARITLRRSIELGSPHVQQSRALLESLG
jgi:Flp pilus assembly protein TadD